MILRFARWRHPLLLAALAGVYFATGSLALRFFGLLHPSASPVWVPTGIAIAALLVYGYRVWPGIVVGAFLVNLTTEGSVATSLGVATGNTLEGLVATYLVRRFAGGRHFPWRAADVFKFAGLAAAGSTTLSATIGVGSLTLGGYAPPEQLADIWFTWWLGDAGGAMVITPLLVLWHDDHSLGFGLRRFGEALLLFAAVAGSAGVIFFAPPLVSYPLAFLCLPTLFWLGLRLGPREAATGVTLLSLIAIAGTTLGHGPFTLATPNESLVVLQAFMAVAALTVLPMAALTAERRTLLRRERAARAEAEAANRAKDQFLAVLGHELRNPLSAISAAGEVLDRLDAPSAGEADRWRKTIGRQTRHLAHLIDDLLDIARVTANKLRLERRPLDLADVIERCVQTLAAAGSTTAARIDVDAHETWVNADPHRLEQIVNNLLNNALKFTPPAGRILVTVFADGDWAVLRVEDTGEGIDPDLLPEVFEPFVQGEQSLERAGGGLGIGLTLVRRLVEMHGGSVEARSGGAGEGSTFTIRLPLDVPPAEAAAAPRIGAEGPAVSHRARILLIEDNADARGALRALLELAGHEPHEAGDGEEGLAAALALRPDVVVLDIGLPGLDGYDVARRLRAALPSVVLVALTGYGGEGDRARAAAAGFHVHLLKPVSGARLLEVIEALRSV